MSVWWIIGAIVAVALIVFGGKSKKSESKHTPIQSKPILTRREQQFFALLVDALPRCYIFPQVSFSAILNTKGFYTRSQFNRKIADFVICDNSLTIIAIIELDDSSHKGREAQDAARDAMLNEAGYPVLRYARIPESWQVQRDIKKLSK